MVGFAAQQEVSAARARWAFHRCAMGCTGNRQLQSGFRGAHPDIDAIRKSKNNPGEPQRDHLAAGAEEVRKMRRSFVALCALAPMLGAGAHAETRQASFVVSVDVPARATLEVLEQPDRIRVSAEDIARGHKSVSARYRVASNTAGGWLLRLAPRLGLAQRIEVSGLESPVVLDREVVEPEHLTLEYLLVLGSNAEPGSYEMPIHVAAVPL
jgi:hypothetical protein